MRNHGIALIDDLIIGAVVIIAVISSALIATGHSKQVLDCTSAEIQKQLPSLEGSVAAIIAGNSFAPASVIALGIPTDVLNCVLAAIESDFSNLKADPVGVQVKVKNSERPVILLRPELLHSRIAMLRTEMFKLGKDAGK